jgi:hypothetical protein
MRSSRQFGTLWLCILLCGIALVANVLRADAIVPFDDPGPLGMQVTSLLNTIKSALETYCPPSGGTTQCMELQRMRHLLEEGAVLQLRELRASEQTIEAELKRQQWGIERLAR